jgi:coproporphyrinogen III oxidase-like Fe-S oxidoreductase
MYVLTLVRTSGKDEKKLPTKAPEDHKKEIPETLMLLGLGYFASGYMGQVCRQKKRKRNRQKKEKKKKLGLGYFASGYMGQVCRQKKRKKK